MPKGHIINLALMLAFDIMPQTLGNQGLVGRVRRRLDKGGHDLGLRLARRYNGALYQDSADRLVLENRIFPYYQLSSDHKRIVFVGCDWYTSGYARRFALNFFQTIDRDPDRADFGAENHHVGPMKVMSKINRPGSIDVVFCNGVIGWGLNDRDEAEASFAAAFDTLRPGGHLIVGWNDLPQYTPFELKSLDSIARFERFDFPPLGASQYRVDHAMQHVFDFYAKPISG
jgi:SAM-dependent methyltransferase